MAEGGSTDVLIVGAGPTGLSLAITLRQHGVAVRIVDRAPHPSTVSKALAIWSASLEALHGMGVVDRFLADGRRLSALCIGDGPRQLARLAVGDGIDSAYPFPLLLPQSQSEELLSARLAELGTVVERETELATLTQDGQHVTAIFRAAAGRQRIIAARYLVGCDGARSAVRQMLGIPFEGYTEPETYLLGDVAFDGGDLDSRSIYIWWHDGGTVALFPFGDEVWRIFAMRGPSPEGADEPTTLAELQRHITRHGPPGLTVRDPSWLSVFRVNERLAARYREGRCFLAGDAAHIHSPAGGQGMNTGIQDGVNLGWKLAYALKGIGDAELLLASYEAERRPVARAVIDGAAMRLHVAFEAGPVATLLKDMAVSVLGNIPAVQRKLQVELSETEIAYRDGPLVALGGVPLTVRRTKVGTRARDAAIVDPATGAAGRLWDRLSLGVHTLLLFGIEPPPGAAFCEVPDLLQMLVLDERADPGGTARERYRLRGPGWVLVRPDQVIAARGEGSDFAGFHRYADRVLRVP